MSYTFVMYSYFVNLEEVNIINLFNLKFKKDLLHKEKNKNKKVK